MAGKPNTPKTITILKHDEAKRRNIPTAEHQSVIQKEEQASVHIAYERGATGTATRNWCGAARTSRTGPIFVGQALREISPRVAVDGRYRVNPKHAISHVRSGECIGIDLLFHDGP